jgi:hypothetical protein
MGMQLRTKAVPGKQVIPAEERIPLPFKEGGFGKTGHPIVPLCKPLCAMRNFRLALTVPEPATHKEAIHQEPGVGGKTEVRQPRNRWQELHLNL